MKILLIGATSALAESVIPILSAKHTIITAGRNNCDITCDLAGCVDFPPDIDVVINLAAYFGGGADDDFIKSVETNTLGTLKICVEAKKKGVKHIILVSSCFALLNENSEHYTSYAITKRHADELAIHYCKANNIPLTIIRPTQIYGDSDSFRKNQPFFYRMIDNARDAKDIAIYGQHNPLRNYIHSDDVAKSIEGAIENKAYGTFTCGYMQDVSFAEIAQTAQNLYGNDGEIIFLEDKPDIPDNIFEPDFSLYEKIGRYPQIDMKTGIQRIINYGKK